MSEQRLPLFKSIYLCDDAVADPASGKMHLIGLCEGFRPSNAQPPFRLRKLCALAQFTDWQGALELRAQIVSCRTLQQVIMTPTLRVNVPSRMTVVRAPLRFRDCLFPRWASIW